MKISLLLLFVICSSFYVNGEFIFFNPADRFSQDSGQPAFGYVQKEQSNKLDIEKPSFSNIDSCSFKKKFVIAASANFRKGPAQNYQVIKTLKRDDTVSCILGTINVNGGRWSKIATTQGDTGWISSSLIGDSLFVASSNVGIRYNPGSKVDFSPFNKSQEFDDNPRVKAKGVYLTIYSAGGARLNSLLDMAAKTDINAFVIDVKDDAGRALFTLDAAKEYAPEANKYRTVRDVPALMQRLEDNNIYSIARIVCFKDPIYASLNYDKAIVFKETGDIFANSDGLLWGSPHDRDLWDYNIKVAIEAAKAGFKEIQFDYVRFPAYSDYSKIDMRNSKGETKPETIHQFLRQAYEALRPYNVYISADVYGLVSTAGDDLQIGQHWESISNVVDYISPMKYPSHYSPGSYGVAVPDTAPYHIIHKSTQDAVRRNRNIETPAIIRPWIQDFTARWVRGHIPYGEHEVREQIRALKELEVDEYLLWNAGNRYTWDALVPLNNNFKTDSTVVESIEKIENNTFDQ